MLLCKFIQLAKNCVKNSNFSFIRSKSVVSSYNEWDPLEEIIVGRAEGCMHPPATRESKIRITKENWEKFQLKASTPYPSDVVNKAKKQVDEFINVLKGEGVVVRRPEKIDYTKMGKYKTPNFESTGYINTCPRDGTLIIGEEIIEAPMSFKSRYFETEPMKDLFNEYFEGGAKWTLAPKPRMKSDLYYKNFPYYDIKERTKLLHEGKYDLTEKEVAFDAADIIRFGKDIFVYRTITSNHKGYLWLKRHLEPKYNVHSVICDDLYALHADTTFLPIKPGLLFVCSTRPCIKMDGEKTDKWSYFEKRGWKVVDVPEPIVVKPTFFSSHWLCMNILSLDEERIIVQKGEIPLIKKLKEYGMKPIEVDMTDAYDFGGAFHCWTLDVRRKGKLQSYL